jgi:hypothetical protein
MEFEIIDDNDVVFAKKTKSKKKYQYKLWEASTPKERARYLHAASRINARRQILQTGEYKEEKNPYSKLIDKAYQYEIDMETTFHAYCEDDSEEETTED